MGGRALPKNPAAQYKERNMKVEKKFKFSENPTAAKIIYGIVIATLFVTAIVVGIIAANNRQKPTDENPPITDGSQDGTGDEGAGDGSGTSDGDKTPTPTLTFISPVSGTVYKGHSATVPVFSVTLEEWRIHTGLDISCAEGAEVFASADGEVTSVRSDPLLGKTVEITHPNGVVSVYSNLASEGMISVGESVKQGDKIGYVGDTTISELADEPHLHFEMFLEEKSVDPLEYISTESKRVSLGITEDEAA